MAKVWILLKFGFRNKSESLDLFRHSKAMHMLAAGINIVYIRDFLGHEDISTTMIYSRADNRLKNEAINKLAPKVTEDIDFKDWTKDLDLMSFLNSFK
jgi:site-specific recombinase XerD